MSNEDYNKQESWVNWFRQELRLERLKPTYVQWICTYKCNFHCKHCGTAAGEAKENELKTFEIIKALDSLANLGCKMFSVTGGEPLMRDDIFDVLGYAKKKGMKIGIVSNGFLTEKVIPQLEKLKLDSILISLDGYGENHDRIREEGSYEKCLKSLDIYHSLKVPMRGVSTVILDDNVDDIPMIIEDVWKRNIVKQRVQPLVPEGRAAGTSNNPETVKKAMKIVLEARKKGYNIEMSEGFGFLGNMHSELCNTPFFCGCGWNTFTIMQDGNVMGCPALDYPELGEGNIRKRDLKDIWKNGFGKFRETLFDDLEEECTNCEHLKICRGGCWLFRANKASPCFLKEAQEIAVSVSNIGDNNEKTE